MSYLMPARFLAVARLLAMEVQRVPVKVAADALDRNHDKLFDGTDIGCVIETRPTHTTTSRVLYYSAEAILAAAERVLSSDTQTN